MNILVGLTSRPESKVALDRAVEEAKLRRGHLTIVRTMTEGLGESRGALANWSDELAATKEDGRALVGSLEEQGVEATFRLEEVSSDPARLLLDVAEEVHADLIVIGIRRRSAVGKLVMGSASQGVLLGAACPVLAVKGPGTD
jgi:nucleotide-binding universal stress UspA family protein